MSDNNICQICKWTNVGCLNVGQHGQPRWVCHGCLTKAMELLESAKNAKAELEQMRAACAAKHDALQTIWDDDEMGWLSDPESECGTEECVKCGAVLTTASKEHAEGCLQGVVHKALSNTCGKDFILKRDQLQRENERLRDILKDILYNDATGFGIGTLSPIGKRITAALAGEKDSK